MGMVNYIYSVLLNARGTGYPAPWERIMSPGFKPAVLPEYLSTVRDALIPARAWWDMTFDAEQALSVVMSPRYEQYRNFPDKRITSPDVEPIACKTGISVAAGNNAAIASPQPVVLDSNAKYDAPIQRAWRLRATTDDRGSLYNLISNASKDVYLALPVQLDPDLSLTVSLEGMQPDALWTITCIKLPDSRLISMAGRAGKIPELAIEQLFNVEDPSQSNLSLFKTWYKTSPFDNDKLAGVVFAYVLKTIPLFK